MQDLLVWALEFRHAALRLRSWSLRFAPLDFGVYNVRLKAKGSSGMRGSLVVGNGRKN